jgi:AraC-like DNA-binding protein
MPFVFSRYSGLLLIFFVHGLIYALLLLHRGIRDDKASDRWLSGFLFLCILYICPWMLGFAGWYDGINCLDCRNLMFYVPFQQGLLMGPVVYFYLKSLINPAFRFGKKELLHFAPGLLYLLWSLFVFIADRLVLQEYHFMDGVSDPDLDNWYVSASLVSLLLYLLQCFRVYRNYRANIVEQLSFADSVTFRWVQHFLISLFLYFLIAAVFQGLNLLGLDLDYTGNWWYYLLFGFIFYYIGIKGYANSVETRLHLKYDALAPAPGQTPAAAFREPAEEAQPAVAETAPVKEISDLEVWKEKLLHAVVAEKAYADPELTLQQLARHLNTNSSLLSRVINTGFKLNFNDFINFYRVEEVRRKLASGDAGSVTIMSLAYDAGFNSKATFNRAFKKFTGKNPKDFLSGEA